LQKDESGDKQADSSQAVHEARACFVIDSSVAILVFIKPNLVYLQSFGLFFYDLVYSLVFYFFVCF